MLPNLIGNKPDWWSLKEDLADMGREDIYLIEDSADTIGYSINGKNAGPFSDIATNSFYASHIISGAGTGGIACFNDLKLYQRAKLLRGWGRSSATFNESEEENSDNINVDPFSLLYWIYLNSQIYFR